MAATSEDELLGISAAASLVGVTTDTLRRWEIAGRVPAIRTLGGQRRFRRSDIERLIEPRVAS